MAGGFQGAAPGRFLTHRGRSKPAKKLSTGKRIEKGREKEEPKDPTFQGPNDTFLLP